jgi:hypothetical protein
MHVFRPVSQRIMAVGADIINREHREPLNPVTALFEPPTMINKSAKRMINNFGGKKEKLKMATPNNTNNNADGGTPLPPAQFLGIYINEYIYSSICVYDVYMYSICNKYGYISIRIYVY